MKEGDLVTIVPTIGNRVEGPIGIHDEQDMVYKEFGIVLEITEILYNEYAYVWWFAYDDAAKGKPSEIIPCQYLKVI